MKIFGLIFCGFCLVLSACNDGGSGGASAEGTVQAARDAGVYISLVQVPNTYDNDDCTAEVWNGSSYTIVGRHVAGISWEAVGPTESEMLKAIAAVKNFDNTVDGTTWLCKKSNAHYHAQKAVIGLNEMRAKLKNNGGGN